MEQGEREEWIIQSIALVRQALQSGELLKVPTSVSLGDPCTFVNEEGHAICVGDGLVAIANMEGLEDRVPICTHLNWVVNHQQEYCARLEGFMRDGGMLFRPLG
jgi:hypothetical protein